MKYMGSKNRFAKELLPIILKDRTNGQYYVEPFAGGMNMIDKVTGNRIANDIHKELIEMWKALVYDKWEQPKRISKDVYNNARTNKTKYEPKLLGWIGFACSFSGDFFNGGCALDYPESRRRKDGTLPSYQQEAINSTNRQRKKLEGVKFFNKNYYDLEIPENSIIYCDPPYENTTSYKDKFNHSDFWQWCREMKKQGHKVFVSEYNAPEDFKCIFELEQKTPISKTSKSKLKKIEKLFTID